MKITIRAELEIEIKPESAEMVSAVFRGTLANIATQLDEEVIRFRDSILYTEARTEFTADSGGRL